MKRARLGREPIEIIESIPFSQTIFLIASGKNYAQIISQERKIAPSPAVKQLKQLEKAGFIVSKKEKLLNKTIYSVNWSRIVKAFIELVEKRKEDYVDFIKKYEAQTNDFAFTERYVYGLDLNLIMDKKLLKNEYLVKALKGIFVFAYQSRTDMNLNISFLLNGILNEPEILNHFLGMLYTSKEDLDNQLEQTKEGRDFMELVNICTKFKVHPIFFSALNSKSLNDTLDRLDKDTREIMEMEEREAREKGEKK